MSIIQISIISIVFAFFAQANEVPRMNDEYDPKKWPQAELKLSQAGTLRDLFDSGLRPYRHPGLENSLLEVKHVNLLITTGSGKKLPVLTIEVMNITPFSDGEISIIEGFTPRLTLAQAKEEMLKWFPYGVNKRSERELDHYLAAVAKDPLDFDDPYRGLSDGCGVGWYEPGFKAKGGGPQFGIGFRKTASQTHPLSLYFSFSWRLNRPSKDAKRYQIPIPPPPGYEHVDMTAPRNVGPDSMVEILRSKGVDIGDGRGGIPMQQYLEEEDQMSENRKLASTKISEPKLYNQRYFWIAIILCLVIGTFLSYFLFKHSKKKLIE